MHTAGSAAPPGWIASLGPEAAEWRTFRTNGGLIVEAWAATVQFPLYEGRRYDSLPWDCRKKGGLVAADDGAISCSEVEVTKRLRAAGFADAGWLATCGSRLWAAHQRPRSAVREAVESAFPGRSLGLPSNGAGAPDVVALRGPHPMFVECKGGERLQDNQAGWLHTLLSPEEIRDFFAVVLRTGTRLDRALEQHHGEPADREPETSGDIVEELSRLFAKASGSGPADRIAFRDPIAAFGPVAIPFALRELDRHPGSVFPLTVIEAIGKRGHAESAATALRQLAGAHPDLRGLAEAARGRLPAGPRATSAGSRTSAIPIGDVPIPGATPPQAVGPCDFLTARHEPCESLGRYPRGDYMACSAHAIARDPKPITRSR